MWAQLAANVIMVQKLLEFFKVVEIAIVMVVRSVEDERTISTITFMESKLCNHLTTHLNLVVWIYAQNVYKLENFPFNTVIKEWGKEKL
jgi:hypothetical protein